MLLETLAQVRAGQGPVGPVLRELLTARTDRWVSDLLTAAAPDGLPGGLALVALGSHGRGEPVAGSDLDLMVLHEPGVAAGPIAERLWYAIWDSGLRLDHSVRTVEEAVGVADAELTAAYGLLDARHVTGEAGLTAALRARWLDRWRATVSRRLPEMTAAATERWARSGELASLLEPDVKEARGGLRDGHLLRALAWGQLLDRPTGPSAHAYDVLLDVRGELHRGAARSNDRLLLQDQDRVAGALGYRDADDLLRTVSQAGRTLAHAVEGSLRRVTPVPVSRGRLPWRRGGPQRVPLAEGVVSQSGEVVLALGVEVGDDPTLGLRVAAAAATAGLPMAPITLERLAEAPAPPSPWSVPVREEFVRLLAAGPGLVAVQEALDLAGIWGRWLPEWEHTRSTPQRNALHRFTVDRHLVEAVVAAASRTGRVARPDLLLVGTLLHDIGKGLPGDHTEVGVGIIEALAPRLGFPPPDAALLTGMCRHHLLLPDVAVRRDLADPATIDLVAEALGGSRELLDLLAVLSEADAAATGPAAWSRWKGLLLTELVRRVGAVLAGEAHPPALSQLTPEQRGLLDSGGPAVLVEDHIVTVAAPDAPGLLAVSAGVLALHRIDIHGADVHTCGGTGLTVFAAAPRFGSSPDAARLRTDLRRALEGSLDLPGELARRAAAYPAPVPPPPPPVVVWPADSPAGGTIVEIRAPDAVGVLHRIAAALAGAGLSVTRARCSTLGAVAVDAFYLDPVVVPADRPAVERAVLEALG